MSENIINGTGQNFDPDFRISARNINRIFHVRQGDGKERKEFAALKDFSLDVKKGEFMTIVGPSGCGKSTFLDILAGLSHPTSGEVYLDGKKITGPGLDRGIVLQGYALFPWRTVEKNVQFGLEVKKISNEEKKVISRKFINLVGLQGFENRYPYELSGGMKQRVAIARALAFDPEVLLMDEPFAAVDAQTRETLQEELLRIWEETHKTVVFITHSIDEAVYLSDTIAVMSSNPGTLKKLITVDIPRARLRTSPEFNIIKHEIWKLLHDENQDETRKFSNVNVVDQISSTTIL